MSIDVQDFIIKPNKFEGLYELSNTVERKNERQQQAKSKADAHRNSLMASLMSYADPKDFFTGTPQDPVVTQSLNAILQKGAKLITDNDGLTADMLYTAIAPDVNKLSVASQNLKQIEAQRKQSEGLLKDHKGIDMDRYNRAFKQNAFYNPDGTLKDLSSVDPSHDYADEALKSGDVFNNTGFDEFSKAAKMNTQIGKVKSTDSRGGMKLFNSELSAPSHLISEKDKQGNHLGFAPKFDIATENGVEQTHVFTNPDGSKTEAPIRLLSKDIFNDLPPDAKAYTLQEARKFAKENNIPINSPQVENFARAFAFDELNSVSKKYGTVKVIEETKQPQIKVYNNSGGSKSASSGVDINDIYKGVWNTFDNPDATILKNKKTNENYGITFNQLDTDAQNVILDFVNKGRGEGNKIAPESIFVNREGGKLKVYKTNENGEAIPDAAKGTNLLGVLPYVGTNTKVNPSVKERQTILQKAKGLLTGNKGNTNKNAKSISINTIKSLVGKSGYEGYTENELVKYYQDNGYEVK